MISTNNILNHAGKQIMSKLKVVLVISFLFLTSHVIAAEPDWTSYQAVLNYVKLGEKHGVTLMLVDYQRIKDKGILDKTYKNLSLFKLETVVKH